MNECTECGKATRGLRCDRHAREARKSVPGAEDLTYLRMRARGLAYSDIASTMGVSRERVRQRLWLADERLDLKLDHLGPSAVAAALAVRGLLAES